MMKLLCVVCVLMFMPTVIKCQVLQLQNYMNEEHFCESLPVPSDIYTITATGGSGGGYTYSFGSDSLPFSVNRNTGEVTLDEQLDHEVTKTYRVNVCVKDGANDEDCKTATVHIDDENDQNPVFSGIPYFATVYEENWNSESIIFTIDVSDADSGYGGSTYQSIAGTTPADIGLFEFNGTYSKDIILSSGASLNYEEYQVHIMTITSTDEGSKGTTCLTGDPGQSLSSNTSLIVNVKDVPDTEPIFYLRVYSASIQENEVAGTDVINVTAYDGDYGLSWDITYAIVDGDDDNYFIIDPNTGSITVNKPVSLTKSNNGQYALTVMAIEVVPDVLDPVFNKSDNNLPMSNEIIVTIDIIDVNDNIPQFVVSNTNSTVIDNYVTTISEDAVGVINDLNIYAEDADSGENAVFEVSLEGIYSDAFSVNPTTIAGSGSIVLKVENNTNLDREQRENVFLQIVLVEDKTGNIGTADLTINISDVNDNAPVLDQNEYETSVSEAASIGDIVLDINATDADIEADNNEITFSLLPSDIFDIYDNGSIYLKEALDREKRFQYYLTVTAASDNLQSSAEVVINVDDENDETPEFQQPSYTISVQENEGMETPLVVTAFDADEDGNVNSEITYSFVPSTISDHFQVEDIDGSGSVTVNTTFDIETSGGTCSGGDTARFDMVMVATDKGTPARSSNASVVLYLQDQNDETPMFDQREYTGDVNEGQTPGQYILTVSATDADLCSPNNDISYEVAANFSSLFTISSSGELKTREILDREGQDVYNVEVFARDNGQSQNQNSTVVVVNVIDINDESPIINAQTLLSLVIDEDTPIGTTIRTINATDPDLNADFTYEITKVECNANCSTWFILETENQEGVLKVNDDLDREAIESLVESVSLTIRVTDANTETGRDYDEGTILIGITDVIDAVPVFAADNYQFSVAENSDVDTFINQVSVTDQDKSDTISFTVNDTRFYINTENYIGKLYVNDAIDREAISNGEIVVVVTAEDSAGLSAEAFVAITITDINDNPPVFNQSDFKCSFTEGTNYNSQTSECVITATDADIGDNADLRYEITDTGSMFAIEYHTGVIYPISPLDRETQESYIINVKVSDITDSPREDTTSVSVTVIDVNDVVPQYPTNSVQLMEIEENNSIDEVIGKVSEAADADTDVNSQNSYFLVKDQDYALFTLNETSRELSANESFDREVKDIYFISVVAANCSECPKSNELQVQINIIDVNDNAPLFSQEIYYASVPSDTQPSDTDVIMTVTAKDADIGENAVIAYSIEEQMYVPLGGDSSTTTDIFSIQATTGYIYLIKPLSTTGSYDLIVTAADSKGSSSSTKVDIQLTTELETVVMASGEQIGVLTENQDQMESDLEKVLSDEDDTTAVVQKILPNDAYTVNVYFYAINTTAGSLLSAEYIISEIEKRDNASNYFVSEWKIVNVDSPNIVEETSNEEYLKAAIIVLAICCVVIIVVFCVAIYFMRESFSRKLRVARASSKIILQPTETVAHIPNTNKHSSSENPLYGNKEYATIDYRSHLNETADDDDIDDNAVDSQDSAISDSQSYEVANEWNQPDMIDIDFNNSPTDNAGLAAKLAAVSRNNPAFVNDMTSL